MHDTTLICFSLSEAKGRNLTRQRPHLGGRQPAIVLQIPPPELWRYVVHKPGISPASLHSHLQENQWLDGVE
jgi:hypothetical protein